MQTKDEWPKDFDSEAHSNRSRPTSRKNSLTKPLSKRSSQKSPPSSQATPKKSVLKAEKFDFLVSGKQILKRSERANSLPGGYSRRPSLESLKGRKIVHSAKVQGNASVSQSSKSRETSLEEDNMSLDLSQLSDFEDASSKHAPKKKFAPATTSTPKTTPRSCQKPRSCSVQVQKGPKDLRRREQSFDSSKYSCVSCKTSSTKSNYRPGCSTELDYSSVSPEYSAPSSTDASPRTPQPSDVAIVSPLSQTRSGSSCYISWLDSDRTQTDRRPRDHDGEWASFWANYNSSVSRVPMMKSYYDQCPTPYRTETIDLADLDFTAHESARQRSPDHLRSINNVIRHEGLHLTPRETQNIIKCAHMLGNVLSKAIDRNSRLLNGPDLPEATILDPDVELKKKTLTLDLKEQNKPLEVKEEKQSETVTTQTDISLPNTKSAPRIFEKILRQLSKSSIEEIVEKKGAEGNKEIGVSEGKVE